MIIQNSLNISTQFKDVSRQLWKFIGSDEAWKCDQVKCDDIQKRLSYFNQSHINELEYIHDVIQGLSKGLYLMKSGLDWSEAAAGHNSNDKPNDTHKARGAQWKLVMIYGGFETVTKTLLNYKKSLDSKIIQELIDKCELSNYASLTPPITGINLERWLEKPSRTSKSAIAHFLGLQHGDQTIIEDWILKSHSISNWLDAVKLSKALRNATAHGALSGTKVKEWKLQKPILTLSDNLGEIVIAAIQKLI